MLGPWLPALPSIMCWPGWLILRSGSYLYLFHRCSGPKLQQPTCCICMAAGEGVERLSAVFDIVDEPAWLKCVALRFCLVAKSLFDDGKCPAETTEFKQQSGGGSSKQRSGSGQCLLQLRQQPASNAMVQMPKVTTVARPALPVAHTCRCDASSELHICTRRHLDKLHLAWAAEAHLALACFLQIQQVHGCRRLQPRQHQVHQQGGNRRSFLQLIPSASQVSCL